MAKPYEKSFFLTIPMLFALLGIVSSGDLYAQRVIPLPPPPPIIWPDERPADPARWTQEDITPEQQYETARKESVAAQQIALAHCKTLPLADQAICLGQARVEFEKEIADIKARFGITR